MIANPTACCCCGDLPRDRFNRRSFMKLGSVAGLAAVFPFMAFGAEGNYDAMVLSCIDPRFPELTLNYMRSRGMLGKYSQFVIAGASIGVVAPAFKDWQKAFWDNLAASMHCTISRKSSLLTIATAEPPRSPMAMRKSRIQRSKPRRIRRR
jgi:hypothetical protein